VADIDIARLKALLVETPVDEWECRGCNRLQTRCNCPNLAFEALPGLIAAAEERDALRKALAEVRTRVRHSQFGITGQPSKLIEADEVVQWIDELTEAGKALGAEDSRG